MAGVTAHVLRDLLGHRTAQVADKYVRELGDPVRRAREQTSQTITALMEGRGGAEIVPLRGRHG